MSTYYRRLIGRAAPAVLAVSIVAGLTPAFINQASAAGGATSTKPSRIGLYGEQDPTYDAVYRQGLTILALTDHGANVNQTAVDWLLRQQCGNGRFESFRTKLKTPCDSSDSNATAMAAMAFVALGKDARANDAVQWLINQQLPNGGWEYTTGWGADTNSTGLVVQALLAQGRNPANITSNGNNAFDFLRSAQLQ